MNTVNCQWNVWEFLTKPISIWMLHCMCKHNVTQNLFRSSTTQFNSLFHRKCVSNFKNVGYERMFRIKFIGISYEIALSWTSQHSFENKPTLVNVMTWWHQATSHYLSQCWPRSMSSMASRPQWVNHRHFSVLWMYVMDRVQLTHWGWVTHICVSNLTIIGSIFTLPGLIFCLLLRVSSDYAQPITGQVTEVTCPVSGQAQPELTLSKRQRMGPGHQQEMDWPSYKTGRFLSYLDSEFQLCFVSMLQNDRKFKLYIYIFRFLQQNSVWACVVLMQHGLVTP